MTEADEQNKGVPPSGSGAREPNPQAVSALRASPPNASIYWALCLAAKSRQDAYNVTWRRAEEAANNPDYDEKTRRAAWVQKSIFLSLAKAAREEAEVLRDAAQRIEAGASHMAQGE